MKKAVKIILITLGVLLVIFAIFVGLEIAEQKKLDKIVNDLINQEEIDMTIKMKGSYGVIEKMIKMDYKKTYELADKIMGEYDNPIIDKCLSASNYQKDGPLFINTRKELNELRENRKKIADQMLELVSSTEANKRAQDYKLDEFDTDLYLQYVGQLKMHVDEALDEDKKFNDILDNVIAILDFLGENKDEWIIEGDTIVFNNQDLLDKYNWLSSKICIDCNNDNDVPSV